MEKGFCKEAEPYFQRIRGKWKVFYTWRVYVLRESVQWIKQMDCKAWMYSKNEISYIKILNVSMSRVYFILKSVTYADIKSQDTYTF